MMGVPSGIEVRHETNYMKLSNEFRVQILRQPNKLIPRTLNEEFRDSKPK
jgi:hypothetical protein